MKSFNIAGIVLATFLTVASVSYLTNEPFLSVPWIVCAVIGAFALIVLEQS
jgi:hypothetical protein